MFYRQFVAVAFDEEFARLRGVPVAFFYLLLLVLVAVTVVLMIQVVGLILVIALLTLPAAVAGQWTRSLAGMMLVATLLGAALTSGGLALSYAPTCPPGRPSSCWPAPCTWCRRGRRAVCAPPGRRAALQPPMAG